MTSQRDNEIVSYRRKIQRALWKEGNLRLRGKRLNCAQEIALYESRITKLEKSHD